MKRPNITRYALLVTVLVAAAASSLALTHSGSRADARAQTLPPVATSIHVLEARFAVLNHRHSNQCALRPQSVESLAVRGRLQGSCCTPMLFAHYVRQVRGLAAYRAVPEIPRDPYDIPVAQARQLLGDDRQITLTAEQRAIYRKAMKLADEHGPCCCHCWRWTTFEGQAKYLIAKRAYSPREIATVWDLEDGCGG